MALKETIAFLEKDLEREFQLIGFFRKYEDRLTDPEILDSLTELMEDTIKHMIMLGEQILRLRVAVDGLPEPEKSTFNIKSRLKPDELSNFEIDLLNEEETLKILYAEQAKEEIDGELKNVLLSMQKDEIHHAKIVQNLISNLEKE